MMRPLKILIGPNPILERVCRPDFVLPERLIQDMFRLMRVHRGYGLAAPQVGIDARLFVTAWGRVFINPILTAHSETSRPIQEACLSFPGKLSVVTRWASVRIGERFYGGEEAIVIQHEIDHLNGITI